MVSFPATQSSVEKYETTTTTCLCPSFYYNGGPCKHIRFVRQKIVDEFSPVKPPQPSELPPPPKKFNNGKKLPSREELLDLTKVVRGKYEKCYTLPLLDEKILGTRLFKKISIEKLKQYDTSLTQCDCPSFQFRGPNCKHIKYLSMIVEADQ